MCLGSVVVVVAVFAKVKGVATVSPKTRELDVSTNADSELPDKDSLRNQ